MKPRDRRRYGVSCFPLQDIFDRRAVSRAHLATTPSPDSTQADGTTTPQGLRSKQDRRSSKRTKAGRKSHGKGNERASIDEKYETLRHQHNYISDIERQKIYAYMTAEERSKLYKMQYDLEAVKEESSCIRHQSLLNRRSSPFTIVPQTRNMSLSTKQKVYHRQEAQCNMPHKNNVLPPLLGKIKTPMKANKETAKLGKTIIMTEPKNKANFKMNNSFTDRNKIVIRHTKKTAEFIKRRKQIEKNVAKEMSQSCKTQMSLLPTRQTGVIAEEDQVPKKKNIRRLPSRSSSSLSTVSVSRTSPLHIPRSSKSLESSDNEYVITFACVSKKRRKSFRSSRSKAQASASFKSGRTSEHRKSRRLSRAVAHSARSPIFVTASPDQLRRKQRSNRRTQKSQRKAKGKTQRKEHEATRTVSNNLCTASPISSGTTSHVVAYSSKKQRYGSGIAAHFVAQHADQFTRDNMTPQVSPSITNPSPDEISKPMTTDLEASTEHLTSQISSDYIALTKGCQVTKEVPEGKETPKVFTPVPPSTPKTGSKRRPFVRVPQRVHNSTLSKHDSIRITPDSTRPEPASSCSETETKRSKNPSKAGETSSNPISLVKGQRHRSNNTRVKHDNTGPKSTRSDTNNKTESTRPKSIIRNKNKNSSTDPSQPGHSKAKKTISWSLPESSDDDDNNQCPKTPIPSPIPQTGNCQSPTKSSNVLIVTKTTDEASGTHTVVSLNSPNISTETNQTVDGPNPTNARPREQKRHMSNFETTGAVSPFCTTIAKYGQDSETTADSTAETTGNRVNDASSVITTVLGPTNLNESWSEGPTSEEDVGRSNKARIDYISVDKPGHSINRSPSASPKTADHDDGRIKPSDGISQKQITMSQKRSLMCDRPHNYASMRYSASNVSLGNPSRPASAENNQVYYSRAFNRSESTPIVVKPLSPTGFKTGPNHAGPPAVYSSH